MILIAGIVGLAIGGFLNSFSYRVEKRANFFSSIHCRHCHQPLIWIDIIPVVSWIYFRAKCRYCKGPLSFIYPLVELSMMTYCILLSKLVSYEFNMFLLLALGFITIAMSLVDIRAYRLPNQLILFLGIFGMVWCFAEPALAMINVCVLAGVGTMLKYGFESIAKTPTLGWGDIKLMAVSGLWIETFDIPIYFIISGFLGVMTGIIWENRMKSRVFPFAPALSMGLLVTVWWRFLA